MYNESLVTIQSLHADIDDYKARYTQATPNTTSDLQEVTSNMLSLQTELTNKTSDLQEANQSLLDLRGEFAAYKRVAQGVEEVFTS